MPDYRVDPSHTRLSVKAVSNVHDSVTVFSGIAGSVTADPESLESQGATAEFRVDMAKFDAGDWLKNRKLKKDLDPNRYPVATYTLGALSDVTRDGERFEARAQGTIDYRGRTVSVEISGAGTISPTQIDVTGSFQFDIRDIGMTPPKILMFKVEPVVKIEIRLVATV